MATRSARYDLNQIPYEYAVEVTNRFKGLELGESVPEELWMELHNTVQRSSKQNHPKEKKNKKAERLSEEALQITKERRKAKSKRERERYIQLNADF